MSETTVDPRDLEIDVLLDDGRRVKAVVLINPTTGEPYTASGGSGTGGGGDASAANQTLQLNQLTSTNSVLGTTADAPSASAGSGTISAKLRQATGQLGAIASGVGSETTAEAAVGATGSVNAKLRRVTTQLQSLITYLFTLAAPLYDLTNTIAPLPVTTASGATAAIAAASGATETIVELHATVDTLIKIGLDPTAEDAAGNVPLVADQPKAVRVPNGHKLAAVRRGDTDGTLYINRVQ